MRAKHSAAFARAREAAQNYPFRTARGRDDRSLLSTARQSFGVMEPRARYATRAAHLFGQVSMNISVALATYNGERHLAAQLESIALQSLLPTELVVSDDGSIDGTLGIIATFAEKAPFPVRILKKTERLGFADNFLFAATACRHELVAFCDQDDVWLPHKLQTAYKRLADDRSVLAIHQLTTTDAALTPTGVWTQGITRDAILQPLEFDPYLNGWGNSMLFRRELVTLIPREHRPKQPERSQPLAHDTWVYTLACGLGRVSHIAEPLILYRLHERNAIGLAKQPDWRGKLTKWAQRMGKLHERMIFDQHIASLFRELADDADSSYADAARVASQRYVERYEPIAARLNIYYGSSMSNRLHAYRLERRRGMAFKSRLKDLVLGVGGLQAFLEKR
jgi:glycosyltransferase involved in cell wall biosynthesis